MLAYACSPIRGSEQGVGWHRAIEAAKYHETWVLCRQQGNEDDIRQYFAKHGEPEGLHFCFVPFNRFEIFIKKIPGFFYLSYNLWHRRAYQMAVKLHKEQNYDLIHQANMCGFREPGYLWKLGTPFIWGPVGGTQNYPRKFLGKAGFCGAVKEGLRSFINMLQFCFCPRVRKAVKKAAVLLTANSTGKNDFQRCHHIEPRQFLEIGLDKVNTKAVRHTSENEPLKILWSGVFEHRKAFHLLVTALKGLDPSVDFQMKILGQGPLEKRWRKLVQKAGIGEKCQWMGWLTRKEAVAQSMWADIFVFTSLRDTAGTVLLEALGNGLPVICLDHQGAGDIVTQECGIKIALTSPQEVVDKIRQALVYLAENRAKLHELSEGAVKRAENFLWSRQGLRMAEVYNEVLSADSRS